MAFCKGFLNPRSTALPDAVPKPGQKEKINSNEWCAWWRIPGLLARTPSAKGRIRRTRASRHRKNRREDRLSLAQQRVALDSAAAEFSLLKNHSQHSHILENMRMFNYSIINISASTFLFSIFTKLAFFNIQNISIPTRTLNQISIQLSPHNTKNKPNASNGGANWK